MQPVLHITASVSTAAISWPWVSIAFFSAPTSFHGRMIRFSPTPLAMPGPCGMAIGAWSGPAVFGSGCLLQYTPSEKPWYMPSKRISFCRPVIVRARRIA